MVEGHQFGRYDLGNRLEDSRGDAERRDGLTKGAVGYP